MASIRMGIGIFATCFIFLLAAHPTSAQMPTTTWRLAAPTGGSSTQLLDEFASEISRRSNGALQIKVFPNSQLGSNAQIKDQLQVGGIEIGEIPLGQFEKDAKIFGVDAIPFSAKDAIEARTLYDSTRSSIEKALNSRGLSILFVTPSAPQRLFLRRELKSAADARAMTWRTPDPATKQFTDALGARSTSVPFAELAEGLSQGRIDAAIAHTAQENAKIVDAAPYVCTTISSIPKNYFLISQRALQQLPASQRQDLHMAARAVEAEGWARWEQADVSNRKEILSCGRPTCELNSDVQDSFRSVSYRLLAAYCPECMGANCTPPKVTCANNNELCCDKK